MPMDKKTIEKNFSKSAYTYEDHASVQRLCAERLIDIIDLDCFSKIIEIGCGTGVYTRMLAERYPQAEITAVDISRDMIVEARKNVDLPKVKFEIIDAEQLRSSEKYDLITSNASFQWFGDLEKAFSSFSKNLSEQGLLCFSMYGPDTFKEFKEVLVKHFGPGRWLSSSGFPRAEEVRGILSRYFTKTEFYSEDYSVDFLSIWDFLQNIKGSGVRGEGLRGAFIGKYAIKEMERSYLEKFGSVRATHNVYFCRGESA